MKRESLSLALNDIADRHISDTLVFSPGVMQDSGERIIYMKKKRVLTFALAAALLLALGISAYALWNVHSARQQELKSDLKIEESHVSSYQEYEVPEEEAGGLVLLSAVNDGQEQHVYVNISPVTEEEAAAFPGSTSFFWSVPGTDVGGFAAPQLPPELSLSGADEIREAVLQYAYDEETQTMTLQCYLGVEQVRNAMETLGTEDFPLQINMYFGDEPGRSFGPIRFTLTEEQRRYFDFGHAVYHDAESDRDIEIVGLELTPFSAVWKVSYDGAADVHNPGADPAALAPWSLLEDKVCIHTKLIFSNGTEFSTGGALTTPYEDGVVNQFCGWGGAIDIDDVQRVVLGDLILWDAG